MKLPKVQQRIYDTIRRLGGEARYNQIENTAGVLAGSINPAVQGLLVKGLIVRPERGLYRLADQPPRTLSTELGIPHKKTVTPVAAPQAELRKSPIQGQRHPASILLEVIAHAPNPREYAGVVQEIGKVLA